MARPKKKPEYNSEEVSQQVIEAVTDAYLNPSEGTADENGKMCLNLLSEDFSISRLKARKMLITSGAYKTPLSRRINELYMDGKTIKEIQEITKLSFASISGYLPYQKTIYNLEKSTLLAERLRKYRSRKAAVIQLTSVLNGGDPTYIEQRLFYVSMGVSVLFTIFGGIAINLLYGEAYLPAVNPLRVATWYIAFSYLGVARNAWLVCENKQRYLKYIYLIAAIANILLNLIFIPFFGATGAAIASLISQIMTSLVIPSFNKNMRQNAKLMVDAIFFRIR